MKSPYHPSLPTGDRLVEERSPVVNEDFWRTIAPLVEKRSPLSSNSKTISPFLIKPDRPLPSSEQRWLARAVARIASHHLEYRRSISQKSGDATPCS